MLNLRKQITQVLDFSNEFAWILSFNKPGWTFIEIMQLLGFLPLKTRENDYYGEETFANIWIYVCWKSARAQNTRMQEISFKLKRYCFFTVYKSFKQLIKYLQGSSCLKKRFCKFVEFNAENFIFLHVFPINDK